MCKLRRCWEPLPGDFAAKNGGLFKPHITNGDLSHQLQQDSTDLNDGSKSPQKRANLDDPFIDGH